jgi:hypothetical protein
MHVQCHYETATLPSLDPWKQSSLSETNFAVPEGRMANNLASEEILLTGEARLWEGFPQRLSCRPLRKSFSQARHVCEKDFLRG